MLYAGGTLVLATALYWYLPSFTKRAVIGPTWAAAGPPVLMALGALAWLLALGVGGALFASGLVLLAVHLLTSAALGPAWRSGIPFWRAGAHRAGDLAAAATVTIGLLLLASSPIVHPLAVWPTGLVILCLGALAHFLPRSRGRAPLAPVVIAGAAIASAAAIARFYAPAIPAFVVPAGVGVAAMGIHAGPATKRAGPRLQEARPALAALVVGIALAIAGIPFALAAAAGAGVLAVAVLALPVVFNQRPAAAFLAPASALIVAAPLAALAPWPIAPIVAALAVAFALAALAPLRRPRRWCPPDPTEAS